VDQLSWLSPLSPPPLLWVVTGLPVVVPPFPAGVVPVVPVDFAEVLPLVWVVTGAGAADVEEFAGCAEPPVVTDDVGAAVVLRARLALVRGAFGTAVVPAVPATVVGELVPGWGGAPAAGVPERCGAVGFSCVTIQTVRRTIWVRTSTRAAGVAFAAGRNAKLVNAPSATSVIAPAIVVAGVLRIRLLL
jgi:hypothetical protein